MHTIAIVGAGFTGTMVAVNLLRTADAPTRILLIERSGRFTAGVAYGTRSDAHLLNVPAGRMSALPDDGDHFLRWARARDASVTGGSFVPRRFYGKYLAELLDDAEADAPATASVVRLASEARAIERMPGGGVRLSLADGRTMTADRVVLSIGNYEPADPPAADNGFYGTERYARDPWAPGALDVDADAPVLLLGTGLTMLDVAIAFAVRGHRGPIHALSRRGLMPQPHRESASAPHHHDRPSTLDTWPRTAGGLLRELRREVRDAAAHDVDWREVVTSIRHDTPALWQSMSRDERRRFLRHLRSFWETHRHRSAPATSARIEALRAKGQLAIHAARVLGYDVGASGVRVSLRPRGAAGIETLEVARVVNCTGPDTNLARVRDPLVRSLRSAGLIRPDELGLGLDTDESGALVGADGCVGDDLFCVGPLRKGRLWENTAVPELRVEAARMARRLASLGPRLVPAGARSFGLALALLPLLTGCFSYALVEPSTAQPGTQVRAHLSPAAAERLVPLLGRVEDRRITGTLLENAPASVLIEVPKIVSEGGAAVQTLNQRVSLTRADLIGLETRTLDRARTGLVVAGAAVVVAVAAVKAFHGQGSSGGTIPGGGTDLRIPLLRVTR